MFVCLVVVITEWCVVSMWCVACVCVKKCLVMVVAAVVAKWKEKDKV